MRVFACLSLTTMPWSSRFGTSASLLRLRLRGALLPRNRPDAGDVATNLAHPRRVLELARRALKAQVEPLLLELERLVVELVDGHVAQVLGLEHGGHSYSAMRATKRVLIGSLAAASPSASLASWIGTPSISNMMRPGLTRATHSSGASALRPYSPNASVAPLVATPRMRPLCALRYLVFFGCSMALRLLSQLA